jgi:hypothetical protein
MNLGICPEVDGEEIKSKTLEALGRQRRERQRPIEGDVDLVLWRIACGQQ